MWSTYNYSVDDMYDTRIFVNSLPRCPVIGTQAFESAIFGTTLAVPELQAILFVLAFSLPPIITTVCYTLFILSFFIYKPLRIVQNFYIVSLAVADIMFAVIVLLFDVAFTLKGQWIFGMHVCKMWLTCVTASMTASKLHLCVIALDRYWAITYPIAYAQKRTLRRALFMIGAVWLVCFVISSLPRFTWSKRPEDFLTTCMMTITDVQVIYTSLCHYIPIFLMSILYAEIYLAIRKRFRDRNGDSKVNTLEQRKRAPPSIAVVQLDPSPTIDPVGRETPSYLFRDHHDEESSSSLTSHSDIEAQGTSSVGTRGEWVWKRGMKLRRERCESIRRCKTLTEVCEENDVKTENEHTSERKDGRVRASPSQPVTPFRRMSSEVKRFIEEKQRISLSKERKAARTLGITMGVFAICWLPYSLAYLISKFCDHCCLPLMAIKTITWLGYSNSALNPIIYTVFNLEFRSSFKKLLRMKWRWSLQRCR